MIAHRFASRQRGMVLVTSLLLLVVVTILAVGMFRSFGLDEKIAGNVREKERAINAAETAEQFAETWLSLGLNTAATNCTGMVIASIGQLCTTSLQKANLDPAVLPWMIGGAPVGVKLLPSDFQPNNTTQMQFSSTGGIGKYFQNPVFYVAYLGPAPSALGGQIYQIDAVGYGGSPDTAAVVESTYLVQTSSKNLGEP